MATPSGPFVWRAGAVVADRFEVRRVAGAGAMGVVYEAIDREAGRAVALKVLRESPVIGGTGAGGPSALATDRLAREAEALTRLSHPAIVRLVAHGVAEGGPFLAMEWIEGESLEARVTRGPLSVDEALTLARVVASALAAAHAAGVVHRDLKPANVVLAGGDVARAVVLDFGIARWGGAGARLTAEGSLLGSPGYMAPEQARSQAADARSDVFALGSVLFECLAGRPAFEGDDPMVLLMKIVLEEPPRLAELAPSVPAALEELVARMLAKDPAERPADGGALVRELAGIGAMCGDPAVVAAAPAAALTERERRILSLVVARPGGLDAARAAVGPLGVAVDELADGTLLFVVSGGASASSNATNTPRMTQGDADGEATDFAARAARCALAARRALPDAAIALVTGRAESHLRWELGALLEDAKALLAEAAANGPVRIDDTSAGLLAARFDVERVPRGGWLDAAPDRGRTLLGKASVCVGRDRELALLSDLLAECAGEPRAQAVLVTGAAGIGKSRLRDEFIAAARASGARVWSGRGDAMSARAPFGVLRSAILAAAGIREGDDGAQSSAKLDAWIARRVQEGTGATRASAGMAEFIGEMVDVRAASASVELHAARQDARLMNDRIRGAWEELARVSCADRPLVLVLDDLHWGDRASAALVDAALAALDDRPLFVLGLGRPGPGVSAAELWPDRRVHTLHLAELTKRAARALVERALAGDIDPATVDRVIEQAHGHPLFLEELARAAADGRLDEGAPLGLVAILEARLARLDTSARRILRAASVFGARFWPGGVAALVGAHAAEPLRGALDDLARTEWLQLRTTTRFEGEVEYAFRHALVRDAAYATLTDADRALGHRMAATWLEGVGEHDPTLLAEHFAQGGEAQRAAAQTVLAAELALAGSDFESALAWAERALAWNPGTAVAARAHLAAATAHRWQGERRLQLAAALACAALVPVGGDVWYEAVDAAAFAAAAMGDPAVVSRLAGELGALPEIEPARAPGFVKAAGTVARGLHRHALFEVAAELTARMERCEGALAGEPLARAALVYTRMLPAMFEGDLGAVLAAVDASIPCLREANDSRATCSSLADFGFVCVLIGDVARGVEVLREALCTAERLRLPSVRAGAAQNLGLALARAGEVDEAIALLRETAAFFDRREDTRMASGTRIYLAWALARAGSLEAAEDEALAGARDSAAPMRAVGLASVADARLARAALQEVAATRARIVAEALEAAEEAMAILVEVGGRLEEGEAQVRVVYAEALRAAGHEERAAAAAAEAKARLFERAAKIKDEALRAGFLERVPENARTLALAPRG